MPLLIVLGILSVYGIASIAETPQKSNRTYTSNDTERMMCEMIGKSKSECKQIAKRYR